MKRRHHIISGQSKVFFVFFSVLTVAVLALGTPAQAATKANVQAAYLNLPLHFEANQGQTDPQVKFLSRGSGYTLFLTPSEAVLVLRQSGSDSALRMMLFGASPNPIVSGLDKVDANSNYFIGSNPEKWHTAVPNYRRVEYRGVYPGVDLIYYGNQRKLEYDFVVAPGADPDLIKLKFDGAEGMRVDEDGDLVLSLSAEGGEVRFRAPLTRP